MIQIKNYLNQFAIIVFPPHFSSPWQRIPRVSYTLVTICNVSGIVFLWPGRPPRGRKRPSWSVRGTRACESAKNPGKKVHKSGNLTRIKNLRYLPNAHGFGSNVGSVTLKNGVSTLLVTVVNLCCYCAS